MNLQTDCDTLCMNYRELGLTVNIGKTKSIWYGSRQKCATVPKLEIVMNGEILKQVVGTMLDQCLTMEDHPWKQIHENST